MFTSSGDMTMANFQLEVPHLKNNLSLGKEFLQLVLLLWTLASNYFP